MKHSLRLYLFIYVSMCALIPAHADPRRAVVLVGDCSGVCVDPAGIVLTSRHCDLPETVRVRFSDKSVAARRIYVCPETEGPVVFDCEGEGFPYATLATSPPSRGQRVWSFGYPARGGSRKLHRASGRLVRGGTFTFRGGEFRGNLVDFYTGPGWSGGPLLNDRGEVCGLLSSGDCRSSVFISFAATKSAVENGRWKPVKPDHEPVNDDHRPFLYVFTSATCSPCRDWHRDYADVADFRTKLATQFRVVVIDVDRQPELARRYGIESVPAFVVVGRPPLFGYTGTEDLLARLFPQDQPKPNTELVARPPIKTPPPSNPSPEKQPATDVQPTPSPDTEITDANPLTERVDRLAAAVETTLTITTWLGITGATGGIGGLLWGGIALLRRFRRGPSNPKPGRDPPPTPPPLPTVDSPKAERQAAPPVVTVDSPPPPQVIVPETRFAPYERDTFAEAFAWAETEIARKYPGAVGTLESLRSLIDQYLAAKRQKA